MTIEISAMTCRGDTFCRCRGCKPGLPPLQPLDRVDPRRLPSNRLVIGSTGIALVLMLGMCVAQH